MKPDANSPVSFRVNILRLPQKGMPVKITASPDQRAELARVHGLVAVEEFRAEFLVQNWKRDGVRVSGFVESTIQQTCIVTLDPLSSQVREDVDALFAPEGSSLVRPDFDQRGEILLDPEGADSPEVFSGDTIDVGALAEEFFALAIDPYPRKEGVALEQPGQGDEEASAFAKLLSLKRDS